MRFETCQLSVLPPSRGEIIDPETLDRRTVVMTSSDTLFCELEGRVIVLHRVGQACFVLSRLAARLWKLMRHPNCLEDLVGLAEGGRARLPREEVLTWIGKMASYGLVDVGPGQSSGSRQVEAAEIRRIARAQHLASMA